MDQSQLISFGINSIIFISMIIVGLDVTLDEFRRLMKKPGAVWTGLVTLTLFVPLSIAYVHFRSLPPYLEAGILLLAICPTGSIANLYVAIGRGNLALSITLSVITGFLAFVTMPLWIKVYSFLPTDVFDFEVPASLLFIRLFFILAFPVALGMWLRSQFPAFERTCHRLLKRVALIGVLVLGAYIIFSDRRGFSAGFGSTVIAALQLSLIGMVISFLVAKLFRLNRQDTVTLILISPVKHFGVAIAIAVSILQQVEFALFATTMFMAQLPLFLAAGFALRRLTPVKSGREPL